ncbi:MAG TPA: mechanosensitive ion channel family protein [Myxococcaceae bacterium]|nr:mechanosensitive ion channel family protein [Myxococcaceae bacterium]
MTLFLQSNVSLVVGAALLLLILGIRTIVRDKDLRQDLRAAFYLLISFAVLRIGAWLLDEHLTESSASLLRLGWMLTFAFGCIRAGVSILLWLLRFRRRAPTPKIFRDVINFALFAVASLPILKATLKIDLVGLVATSAILSVVIGLAMQDTLGNLFAGLSLQLERPFEVGDFVSIGENTGRIAQVGWRATRIETFRNESITVPNNVIAKAAVKNYSRAGHPIGTDCHVGISYAVPPNRVKAAVLDTLHEIPEVLTEPPPVCRTGAYEDSAIRYQIRFFARDLEQSMQALEQLHTRLWYRFTRDGIEIPFPQRVVHLRSEPRERAENPEEVLGLLQSIDLLALLPPDLLRALAREAVPRRFGQNERVITQGDEGNSFYVVAEGSVSVRVGLPEVEVARLERGQYFGEMSLLTGEPRAASVIAAEDTLLLEISRPIFARILGQVPELAAALADLLARRRTELDAVAMASGAPHPEPAREARRIFTRLREIFGLSDP